MQWPSAIRSPIRPCRPGPCEKGANEHHTGLWPLFFLYLWGIVIRAQVIKSTHITPEEAPVNETTLLELLEAHTFCAEVSFGDLLAATTDKALGFLQYPRHALAA